MEDGSVTREALEKHLVNFQRHFLGGKSHEKLETCTTGGGTRSINLAFESTLARVEAERRAWAASAGASGPPFVFAPRASGVRVLTGNPHLAVERAQRRFGFDLVRLDDGNGCLSVEALRRHVQDPAVVAVYSQTLSFTDGISDDVGGVLEVLEEENKRRLALRASAPPAGPPPPPLITHINDCCLAFSVLVHNGCHEGGGWDSGRCLRLLDLALQGGPCVTPCVVTQDAHKHLGTDKGVSTVVGTPGTLSHLTLEVDPAAAAASAAAAAAGSGSGSGSGVGHGTGAKGCVRVGSQPSKGQLVRAIADCFLVSVEGYYAKYRRLASEVSGAAAAIEAAGLTVVHGANRAKGSTVLAVEDESCALAERLKPKG
jgi:hypothetical protein